MQKALINMFTGWKTGTIGRLQFILYFVFLLLFSAAGIFSYINYPGNPFIGLFFWFSTVLDYYCGLLVMIKRYRELTRFAVLFALSHWGIAILAAWQEWPALAVMSLVLLLVLMVAPGREISALPDAPDEH